MASDGTFQVVLDLGKRPEARFLDSRGGEYLRDTEARILYILYCGRLLKIASTLFLKRLSSLLKVRRDDLTAAENAVGDFGGDNRAGVPGTLHRISAIRNRKGHVVGLTCRVGRAVTGHIDMIRDILGGAAVQQM